MVGGPIAIGYNLSGVDNLVLDAPTIAKIFDAKIKKWNDPAIKKLNPDAKLPRHRRSRRSTAPTSRAPRRTSPST